MSIARVPGYSLLSDLDRQGIDLEFSTNGQTLTYMDFANFRLGVNTSTPSQSLEVVGNVLVTNGHVYSSANVSYDIGSTSNWFRTIYANSITSNNLTGTIQTVNQPNITGLGNLANLTVLGNIVAGNISTVGTISITGNLSVDNLTANTYTGNIITGNQPFITNLANITLTNLTSTANVSANWLVSNYANIGSIYGTILTANQPYISNLGNISVESITIGGNISITGNTTGGVINADELYENSYRVLTSNSNIVVSGDVVGSGTYNNVAVSLINVGVTAGLYGDTSSIPSIVVDSKGRVTSAANVILTRVGNITVNNTTLSTSGNLILSPNTGIVDAGNSRISNIAEPVNSSDAVTKSYLESALVFAANVLAAGDSTVTLTDNGVANLATILDGNLTSVQTPTATTFYQAVTVGELTTDGDTISSTGNIILDATGAGIVQIVGTDALGIPAGGIGTRPSTPMIGYTRFNTDTSVIETWDGNTWSSPGITTVTSETIVPDGVSNSFTLSSNVSSAYGLLVSINGTLQQPVTSYDVNINQLIFTEVPQITDVVEVRSIAAGVTVSALQYGATEVELSNGNVNISGNLIPQANVTYDIGSENLRWRDLYLAGNTINLGGATLSTDGNTLNFTPAGSGALVSITNIYDDANVAAYLPTYTGNISAGNVNANSVYVGGESVASLISSANTNMKGYVDQQVTTVLNNAPEILDTLGEIANALGNDANLSTTLTNMIGNVQANVTTANTNMKGYVDNINSTLTANAGVQADLIADLTSNAAVQAGQIITANTNMKGYVDGQISGVLDGTSFTGTVAIPTLTLTNALAINYGGTGGTSSSEALNNLLPSGETSGYVLKTSGPGTYYWAAESGAGSTVGTIISTSRVYKTATAGQTVFTGIGTYTPGAGQLRIYINGVRQFDSAYTETNSSAVTLSTGVTSGTVILAEIDAYTDYNVYANATYSSPVGTISATTVQDALAELDTEKAALSGANFTGNISVPYITGATIVTGNLTVGGNLNVLGNVTTFNSNNVTIQDALIYLADDNGADVLDIGFVSAFTDATRYQHTGLARDASDSTWKLFANVVAEPTTTIDFTNATYSNLRIGQLTSTGVTATGPATVGNLTANNTSITGTMTQNGVVGGIVPVGGIIMWSGNVASIPTRWALCNGSNGTPDLRDRFIVGAGSTYAPGATGGSANAIAVSHSHTASSTFTGSAMSAHGHSASSSSTFTGTSMAEHNHTASASSSFSGSTLPSHTHVATSTVNDPGHSHVGRVATTLGGAQGQSGFEEGRGNPDWSTQTSTDSATTGITVGTSISSESAGTPSGSVSTSVSVGLMSAGVPEGSVSTSTSVTAASAGTPSGSVATTVDTAGSSGTNANLPPYYALAYIMRTS